MQVWPDASVGSAPFAIVVVEVASPREVTIYRSSPGGTVKVRGGKIHASGSTLVRDFEVPLNTKVRYWAVDSSGEQVDGPVETLVNTPYAWIHDADAPSVGLPIAGVEEDGCLILENDSLKDVTRDSRGETAQVIGSRYPVALGGGRHGGTGISMNLIACWESTRDAFASMIDGGGVLCIRGILRDKWKLPEVGFLNASSAKLSTIDEYGDPWWRASLSGELVRGPTRPIVFSVVTYDDVDAALAAENFTYDSAEDATRPAEMTYTDVDRQGARSFV